MTPGLGAGALDTDVVIVGGGPVGLFLAADLALGGTAVTVLERGAGIGSTGSPQLRGLTTRTLHTFALRGMLAPVEEAAVRAVRALADHAAAIQAARGEQASAPAQEMVRGFGHAGPSKGHFGMLPLLDRDGAFADVAILPVGYVELTAILADRAVALGVDLRRGHEVVTLAADADGVEARTAGGTTVRAAFAVGCDGGRSVVRAAGGFGFPGTGPFMAASGGEGVVLDPPDLLPRGMTRTAAGLMMVDLIPGQVIAAEFGDRAADRQGTASAADLEAALRRVSGTDVAVKTIDTAFRYTDNARQASDYRVERLLLAGDAAHVHSPFGGQGLNLGLQDAVNLGWKLSHVAAGRAPVELLDTYTAERHPAAARVLRNTRAQAALLRPGPQADALREVLAEVIELPAAKRHLVEMMNGLDTRYDLGGGHPLVGAFLPRLEPLDAGADALLAAAQGVLVDLTGAAADPPEPVSVPRVRTLAARCPAHPELAALLVRPDGYVAWAADQGFDDGATLARDAALARWFGAVAGADETPAERLAAGR